MLRLVAFWRYPELQLKQKVVNLQGDKNGKTLMLILCLPPSRLALAAPSNWIFKILSMSVANIFTALECPLSLPPPRSIVLKRSNCNRRGAPLDYLILSWSHNCAWNGARLPARCQLPAPPPGGLPRWHWVSRRQGRNLNTDGVIRLQTLPRAANTAPFDVPLTQLIGNYWSWATPIFHWRYPISKFFLTVPVFGCTHFYWTTFSNEHATHYCLFSVPILSKKEKKAASAIG